MSGRNLRYSMTLSKDTPPERVSNAVLARPFILAVAMLGAAAVLVGPVATAMNFKLAKQPLPLRAPLSQLEDDALAPYRIVERHILQPTIVDALGTDQYLNWTLEDTSAAEGDPLRHASLLVTYYTGGQNLVPHTPDVCYFGAGYEPAEPHGNRVLTLGGPSHHQLTVPIRVCTFRRTSVFHRSQHTVVYTFHSNGRFVATRTGVRMLINDPTDTYAYFSKVEVAFPLATREESIAATGKLLERVLPLLLENHWPDFEKAEADDQRRRRAPQ